MSWQLVFTEQYTRRAARFFKRDPEVESVYSKALRLIEVNPHHPSLRVDPLKGRLNGLHGVSIKISVRMKLEMIIFDKDIILINVAYHDEVYR